MAKYSDEKIKAAMEALEREETRKAQGRAQREKNKKSMAELEKTDPARAKKMRLTQQRAGIKQRLLVRKAKAAGITVTAEEVEKYIKENAK